MLTKVTDIFVVSNKILDALFVRLTFDANAGRSKHMRQTADAHARRFGASHIISITNSNAHDASRGRP